MSHEIDALKDLIKILLRTRLIDSFSDSADKVFKEIKGELKKPNVELDEEFDKFEKWFYRLVEVLTGMCGNFIEKTDKGIEDALDELQNRPEEDE